MTTPHPTDPGYVAAYGRAWSDEDPATLVSFFSPDGEYRDVAMGSTCTGHDALARFHRFMLRFAADSTVVFGDTHAADGRLYAEWVWSGSVTGKLRLRSGALVDASGATFTVPGIASCRYGPDGLLTAHHDYWDLGTLLDQAAVRIG